MAWKNDYSVTQLFANKRCVTLRNGDKECKFFVPTLREDITDTDLNKFLGLISNQMMPKLKELLHSKDDWGVIKDFLTNPAVTNIEEFKQFSSIILKNLQKYWVNFSISPNREILWDSTIADSDLWNEFSYLFLDSSGIEQQKEVKFANESARKLWEEQMAAEAKIARMRGKNSLNEESIIKACLQIMYSMPSFKIDDLLELSVSQFKFIQGICVNYPSYEIEKIAYAMGNLKEAPTFFIK